MDTHVHKINRSLVAGWLVIVGILFVSYCGEVLKGERTLSYLAVFMLVTAVPAFFCLFLYRRKPDMFGLRYYIVVGYFLMYLFCMMTGSTSMVFSYILPMLSFLVLYHQPRLILYTGAASMLVNIASIAIKFQTGEMTLQNSKDGEIQIALLFLCFAGSYMATRLYDEITDQNTAYLKMLDEKNNQIQKMTLQTITTIANTIDAKDEYTRGHSKRVSEYSAAIARELGMSEEEIQNIRSVALLHDIGKIGVPDAVLNKPGKLTQEEYRLMKQHTVIGAEILKDIGMLPGIDVGAKYHHERYDGTGYPEGLAGEEIPYIARIIAVADSYDAMTSNRVYRKHLGEERVLKELKNGCGTQFDPEICGTFIRLLEEKRLENISPDHAETQEISDTTRILSRVIEKREEQVAEEMQMDELTNVYNRSYGEKQMKLALKEGGGCLMLVDMDRFRRVNDKLGFMLGDVCLKVIADCIMQIDRDKIISRFGGDEFAVFFQNMTSEQEAVPAVEAFLDEIRRNVREQKELDALSVSIGIAFSGSDGASFSDTFLKADKALYFAKQQGGGTYYFYRQSVPAAGEENLSRVDLNQLVHLIKEDHYYEDSLQIAYSEVKKVYEFVKRIAAGNHQQIHIIMFTVSPNSGAEVSVEERERVLEMLERAIAASVRGMDVTMKYSSTQRLVILMNPDEEKIQSITEHIMKEFYKMYDRKEISVYYDMADLS